MPVRVLIADDSVFIRELLRRHLERIGCEVVGEAENAEQTLNLCRALKPDLVTLDLVMPESEGIDTLAAFHAIRSEAPQTAVIVITAVPFDESRETYMKGGALDYIVKPFGNHTFQEIRQKLEKIFPQLKLVAAARAAGRTPTRRSSP